MDRSTQESNDLDFTATPPPPEPADEHGALADNLLRRARAERERDAVAREVQAEAAVRGQARALENARRADAKQAARAAASQRRRAIVASAWAAVERLRRAGFAWGTALLQWALLFVALGAVGLHLVPFAGMIPRLEQAAAAQFGQPVRIGKVHLWLVPLPHWRIDDVIVGDANQLRVPRVKAAIDLGNLFGERPAYRLVELEAPTLKDEALGWLLFGRPQGQGMLLGRIEATGARLDSRHLALPPFDAVVALDRNDRWRRITLASTDRNLGIDLRPGDGRIQVDFRAATFRVPFGAELSFDDFHAEGSATRDALVLTEFTARGYGGSLAGRAQLGWAGPWLLEGSVEAKDIAAERVLPRLAESGRIDGRALFAMQADEAAKLFAAPRLQGDFVVRKGALLGVDLGRLLQGDSIGGKTLFASLDGIFQRDGGTTRLRQMRLTAGILSARGNIDVDAARNLRGRFAAELTHLHVRARGNLTVSGTLDFPRFSR